VPTSCSTRTKALRAEASPKGKNICLPNAVAGLFKRLFRRTEAQDTVEYALLAGLICLIVIAALATLGGNIRTVYWNVDDAVASSGTGVGGGNPGTGAGGGGSGGAGSGGTGASTGSSGGTGTGGSGGSGGGNGGQEDDNGGDIDPPRR
jgi:Flp pilus assembly pilin Flp